MDINQSSTVRRIRRLSFGVKWLCILALVIFIASVALNGLSLHLSSETEPVFRTGDPLLSNPIQNRLASLPYQLSVCAALVSAIGLFNQYAQGAIFTQKSVLWFWRLAFSALFAAVLNAIKGILAGFLGWFASPQEPVKFVIDLGAVDILAIGFAVILLAIAIVQHEAQQKLDDLRLIF